MFFNCTTLDLLSTRPRVSRIPRCHFLRQGPTRHSSFWLLCNSCCWSSPFNVSFSTTYTNRSITKLCIFDYLSVWIMWSGTMGMKFLMVMKFPRKHNVDFFKKMGITFSFAKSSYAYFFLEKSKKSNVGKVLISALCYFDESVMKL